MVWISDHDGQRRIVDQRHRGLPIVGAEAASDAFGRLRAATPETLFDSKLLNDKAPLLWDEVITDTSGNAASTHVDADSLVTMYVEATDTIQRQTKMRFNYQPGKSQLILMTGILTSGGTGVTGRIGAFDANNGLFFEVEGSTVSVGKRKGGSDTTVAQANWNLDQMDGTGPSGVTIDFDKAQIFVIDYEWLGVGRIRYGFGLGGSIVYCHETTHENLLTSPYTKSPNLPLRYEIASAAGGDSVTMKHICATVISEGGSQSLGVLRSVGTNNTHINANTADTMYPILGIRLSTGCICTSVVPVDISVINEQAGDFQWFLALNPSTIANSSTLTWTTSNAFQYTVGSSAHTIPSTATFGLRMTGGYVKSANQGGQSAQLFQGDVLPRIGATIAGVRDQMWVVVKPLAANADIQASITIREQV